MKLDRYDVGLTKACETKDARPILTMVSLRDGELAAANEFMFAVRDADLPPDEKDTTTLLPAAMLNTLKLTSRKQATLQLTNDKATVSFTDNAEKPLENEPEFRFSIPLPSTPFPDYKKLYGNPQKKAHIALSVSLLRSLLSMLPGDGILCLGIREPTDVVEFECSNMERPIRGAIMPMFVNWAETKWHGPVPEKTVAKPKKISKK